jgi:hypothetical protein
MIRSFDRIDQLRNHTVSGERTGTAIHVMNRRRQIPAFRSSDGEATFLPARLNALSSARQDGCAAIHRSWLLLGALFGSRARRVLPRSVCGVVAGGAPRRLSKSLGPYALRLAGDPVQPATMSVFAVPADEPDLAAATQ